MASKPKPFLRKGQGKYTKIDYPVLRRSGVYQPTPDTQPALQETQRRPVQQKQSPRRERAQHDQYSSSPSSFSRLAFSSVPPPPLPLRRPQETGLMGMRSPSESEDSPRSPTASGRPRTAGTVDSGFPREEPPPSPLSPFDFSTASTHASSIPYAAEDYKSAERGESVHRQYSPVHSPVHSPAHSPPHSPVIPTVAAPIYSPHTTAEEDEVGVEPSSVVTQPIPAPRTINRSIVGPTTEEFVRRERQAMRDERGISTPPLNNSSAHSTISIETNELRGASRQVIQKLNDDKGEEPYFRRRLPYESAAAATGRNGERMIGQRLDETDNSNPSSMSPIDNPTYRPTNVHDFTGASFRESEVSRPGSSSHFRIGQSSRPDSGASQVDAAIASGQRAFERLTQYEQPLQQQRRRSVEERSEASSGSTAAARNFLLGDRRPLDEIGSARSRDEITMTQQRPRHQIRPSQATYRFVECSDEEPEETEEVLYRRSREGDRGTRTREGEEGVDTKDIEMVRREARAVEERARLVEIQLRDALAHNDLSDAALRRTLMELQQTFDRKITELAALYAEKGRKIEEERRREKETMEQMQADLEKEKILLRKGESAKVKALSDKVENTRKELSQKDAEGVELKKKLGVEVSKRRRDEKKANDEREKMQKEIEKLKTENERMKTITDKYQRQNAVARGLFATRAGLARAEDEAAAAPRRGRLSTRYGGAPSAAVFASKENLHPLDSSYPGPSAPQGILKKNNVRFADTTFTVEPPLEEITVYEDESSFGPAKTYVSSYGHGVRATRPACNCLWLEYPNGDRRHWGPDRAVTFHYFDALGMMEFDFPEARSLILYTEDGMLNIFRTGREITKCGPRGDKICRTEVMKRENGTYYAEIWEGTWMAIDEGKGPGPFKDQYATNRRVTNRQSRMGKSFVRLHSKGDYEFFEMDTKLYILYEAATRRVELALNASKDNEIRYYLEPGRKGMVRHAGSRHPCIHFGHY